MSDSKMDVLNTRLGSLNEELKKEQEAFAQLQAHQKKVEQEISVRGNNVLIIAAKVQECKDTIAIFTQPEA